MAELKEFIVAIELGSSKMTAIAGQKKPDGSISVLAMVREESSSFIHKGVVYNIDKTAQCLSNIVKKLEMQLNTRVRQVFVGVGGQSVHSVRNTIVHNLDVETIVTREMVTELMDENRATDYPDQAVLEIVEQEYRVDSNLQTDPVGIRASRLEGNFLNILIRRSFLQNLIKSFEAADVKVAGGRYVCGSDRVGQCVGEREREAFRLCHRRPGCRHNHRCRLLQEPAAPLGGHSPGSQ